MHSGGNENVYRQFKEDVTNGARTTGPNGTPNIITADYRGDCFFYSAGNIQVENINHF